MVLGFTTQNRYSSVCFFPTHLLTIQFFWRAEFCMGSCDSITKKIGPTMSDASLYKYPVEAELAAAMVNTPISKYK